MDVFDDPQPVTARHFPRGWCGTGPHKSANSPVSPSTAILAGGCASATVDVALYPLDTLKTRLQSPLGFARSGGFTGLFRGVLPTAIGAVPGGAAFFGSYELGKQLLLEGVDADDGDVHTTNGGSLRAHWAQDALAATVAASANCLVRNPLTVVAQRMQVGQYDTITSAVRGVQQKGGMRSFYAGLGVSAARELPFAFIQFPIYEGLKRLLSADGELSVTQGAACGSIAGAIAAALTTPLDVVRTRLMLGYDESWGTLRKVLAQQGPAWLFSGLWPRVGWMTIGGFIFFGVYELCLQTLLRVLPSQPNTHSAQPQPDCTAAAHEAAPSSPPPPAPSHMSPTSAVLAGGLAGMMTDALLHPIDTLKTRSIQGLSPFSDLGGAWRGIGVALVPAVPAAAAFFLAYETAKHSMRQQAWIDDKAMLPYFLAAGLAEGTSCIVRVPFEQLKMRLQAQENSSLSAAARSAYARGGLRVLYKGLGATLALDLPFALVQFPLFEALRHRLSMRRVLASGEGHVVPASAMSAVDGALAGAIAGVCAAVVTTPLDVVRTRHVLGRAPEREQRRPSALDTARLIYRTEGARGFVRGIVPRTLYMGLGGVVYLGTYALCSSHLEKTR
mmetsp:Transcript_51528/g.118368  ORF Transcript_51528/g.118368 Transcript_51528/m.118368 type:complete len:615 (-) Transcript_51528:176-2020(-)